MKRHSIALFMTLVSLAALPSCAPKGGGGGQLRPGTVALVPHMITGKGSLRVVPKGSEVELTLHATALPPPATYSLWLARSGDRSGLRVASFVAQGGRIDYVGTVPADRLAGFDTVELLHQPSGKVSNFSAIHPALEGTLPRHAPPH